MDRFIARANIRHFRERLLSELDQHARARLQGLLVEEEDKLATDFELIADIDQHIEDGNHRIDRQRALVDRLERDGHDGLAHARLLLGCLIESQLLHQNYRRRVLIRIQQTEL